MNLLKPKSLFVFMMLMVSTTILLQAQELPPKHRGMHPTLQKDGKVVDENGKQLGYITKDGKVCDVTGKVIGIIAKNGDVTTANGKGIIGVVKKDGSFKSKSGHVVTTGGDGTIMAAGKMVGHVDAAYKNKMHACAVHCFFSEENEDAKEIDSQIE